MTQTDTLQGGVQRTSIDDRPAWLLSTRNTAVLLSLGANDALLLPYWGPSGHTRHAPDYLPYDAGNRSSERLFLDGLPLAYPVYGEASFLEPCLVVSREDGSRGTRLEFAEDRIVDGGRGEVVLELVFRDAVVGLSLEHRFCVFSELDLVVRSVTLRNLGAGTLTLERVLTGALPLPPGAYDAYTLHGQWGREFELRTRPLLPGKFITDSRRGISSHEAHPWFAVRPRGETAEHQGAIWFGSLAWSGNWIGVFESERNDAISIAIGIQPFDFAWRLGPGQQFSSPELVGGYSEQGLGGAARLLHVYDERVQLPDNQRERLRPVLYNSWEATHFDVRADQQLELARRAAAMGVELFVVDDGWFGARDNDRAGLGDWTVNVQKLPGGLRKLIEEVHGLGMQFGIWVEPEMVNPDSDLYRAHPDWVYHADGREPTFGRNQLVLNFARQDVQEAIHAQLQRLLTDHGTIDFLKWDHNRAWTEVGWPERPGQQREVWVRHVRAVYDLLSRLRAEFPNLLIESCAGGGGRADLGILRWTDQVWTSDNTDAADRLTIQYGYSHAHSPRTMVNWVTDVPNQQTGRVAPLEFRFHVAMQGVLGLGGDIGRWPAEELRAAQRLIETYKTLRSVVQHGRQYWLLPPTPIGPCGVQYVSQEADETVVFVYQVRGLVGAGVRRARLRGLVPDGRYRRDEDGAESTGAALMGAGVPIDFRQPVLDWRSRVEVWRAI
ncbi:MAG: alpha-galactosidase [Chloroflexota bacterium]|nr:alpha-galactosidase [Chloroflexota bacterium]